MTAPITEKPFPWKCAGCGERSVVRTSVNYTTRVEHDGRVHTVTVPDLSMPRCPNCGHTIRDSAANQRITAALRAQLGLLSPEQIRGNREALSLTQKQLADRLGIADATLSRWENGIQIQQRSLDRLMRLFFGLTEVRNRLADEAGLSALGVEVIEPARSRHAGR